MNTIRFAIKDDIDKIMDFIDVHWKKDHILARDKDFFCFQHVYSDEVSYVIGENQDGELVGILGYIPYGKENRDVFTVMWKVLSTDDSMLGIKLLMYLVDKGDVGICASPGINKKTVGIYNYLGYYTGTMRHWYRLNTKADYAIGKIADGRVPEYVQASQQSLHPIGNFDELEQVFNWDAYKKDEAQPYKTGEFIKRRYFSHPIFEYKIFGVMGENHKADLITVFRVQEHEGHRALRLIDAIGRHEDIKYITAHIDRLLVDCDAEYVDMYEAGLNEEWMNDAGWLQVGLNDNIIPEYFAPYVCENVDINYFSTEKDVILFKGDGDQDRPN